MEKIISRGLVGKFFHSFREKSVPGSRVKESIVEWQGLVLSKENDDYYFASGLLGKNQ